MPTGCFIFSLRRVNRNMAFAVVIVFFQQEAFCSIGQLERNDKLSTPFAFSKHELNEAPPILAAQKWFAASAYRHRRRYD